MSTDTPTKNYSRSSNSGRRRRPSRGRSSRAASSGGRSRGGRGRSSRSAPRKKKNPIIEFLAKLFGFNKTSKNGAAKKSSRGKNSRSRKPRAESTATEPEAVNVTTPKLYVGNLSYDLVESDLFDLFEKVGQVKNVEIVRDRNSNSKGFGFVEMASIETAKQAVDKYHRTDFEGRQLVVSGAKKQ